MSAPRAAQTLSNEFRYGYVVKCVWRVERHVLSIKEIWHGLMVMKN